MTKLLTALYLLVVPAIALVGYLPQLRKLLRSGDSSGLSMTSWLLWTVGAGISLAYACCVLHDVALSAVCALHLLFSGLIYLIGLRYRVKGSAAEA